MDMGNFKLPGVSFSWKRALGLTKMKQHISRQTGVPMTRGGLERKIGRTILNVLLKNRLCL